MTKHASLVGHAVVGWAICGATIGIGRQLISMQATLWVHAAVAPLAFGLLTSHFIRTHPSSSPLATAIVMLGVVVGFDALVVAPFFERSYAMFSSVLGTWIPFLLIFAASYGVARSAEPKTG